MPRPTSHVRTRRRGVPATPPQRSSRGGRAPATAASAAVVCGLVFALATPVVAAGAASPDSTAPNVEEARLNNVVAGSSEPTSRQFIQSSGLQARLVEFDDRLATASSAQAPQIVADAGAALWTRAVDGAQGKNPEATGDRYDDRGLYWARLAARMSVKNWVAADPSRAPQLQALLLSLEKSSRGFADVAHTDDPTARRILTTGFDPFLLDDVGQRSNPSGSAALVLDGTTIDTPTGPAVVQAVVLPVNWSAFDTGIVEDVYGPGLRYGARSIDMLVTLSQGRVDGFDIERFAGVWRGGNLDNLRQGVAEGYRQEAPVAPADLGWPQPTTSPQFIETSLPGQAMVDASTGPAPVRINGRVCAAPTALRDPAITQCGTVSAIDPSWFAVQGGGGDYLSNESFYRANRLRLQMGRTDVAGGHLHTKSLSYASIPAGQVTSPAFESDRAAVVDQTVALFGAAAQALRRPAQAHAAVTPAEASRGDELSVAITGLIPREPFRFKPPVGPAQEVVADDEGSVTVTWPVAQDAPPGRQTLMFERQDGSSFSGSVLLSGGENPTPTPTPTPTATGMSSPTATPTSGAGAAQNASGAAGAMGSKHDADGHPSSPAARTLAQSGPADVRVPLVLAVTSALLGLLLVVRRRRSRGIGRR